MKKTYIIFALVIFICIAVIFSANAGAAYVIGDANGDGTVSILDATAIQRHLALLTIMPDDRVKAANVSGTGDLNIMDATLIQRKLARLIDKFPAESVETQSPTQEPTQEPTQPPTQIETVTPVSSTVDIYFTNNKNWSQVNAYLFNYSTDTPAQQWPGMALTEKSTNEYNETVYHLTVDTSKYDRIIFNDGNRQTTDTPVTVANSGYFIMTEESGKSVLGVYPYGQSDEGTIKQVDLQYSTGYNKRVTIWTPAGYNATDKSKKYSVLYMTDGQNIFGNDENCSQFEWECDETVLSLMQNGGDGVIVVGIDNSNNKRDNELTPNLGPVVDKSSAGFENGTGEYYSNFVVNTVIPYVEANYNTNSIRGVAGSSSGGLEAFYIGMQNLDKFDYIGAISPAFILFSKNTWYNYLYSLDFSNTANLPRIYFYNGKGDSLEVYLLNYTESMQGWMQSCGYPSQLMTTVVDNNATHNEKFWTVYFPEMLSFGLGLKQ